MLYMYVHAHIGSDIRDLISIDDVMEDEDLKLGPNGGLVFCLEWVVHVCILRCVTEHTVLTQPYPGFLSGWFNVVK